MGIRAQCGVEAIDAYSIGEIDRGHVKENALALIFLVHHAQDEDIVDLLLSRTLSVLGETTAATLSAEETELLENALQDLPRQLVAGDSITVARADERRRRDRLEAGGGRPRADGQDANDAIEQLVRSWRMMEVLGQILKNKYGSWSRGKLRNIVGAINKAGLRLIGIFVSEERICNLEKFFMEKAKDSRIAKDDRRMIEYLRKRVRAIIVLIILGLLEHIAACIRKPELDGVVQEACNGEGTPAHDIIRFLFLLNTTTELTKGDVGELEELLDRFARERNAVAERLLAISVERYLRSHNVEYGLRQRIYGILDIRYSANPRKEIS